MLGIRPTWRSILVALKMLLELPWAALSRAALSGLADTFSDLGIDKSPATRVLLLG